MVKTRFTSLMLLVIMGCYEAVPLTASRPPVGREVEVKLTDAGSTALGQLLGAGAASVRGRYEGTSGDTIRLRVVAVSKRGGSEDFWNQERVEIPASAIATVREMRISVPRTALVIGLGALAAGLIRLGFSGRTNTSGTRRPPPAGQ